MRAQTHIMDLRLYKHNPSKSSSTSPNRAAQPNHIFFKNAKNVFRFARTNWAGPVPVRFNIETMKDEYWLRLDFVNFEGWCTEAFLNDEVNKSEQTQAEKVNR